MCRNIKTLFNFAPPATDEEMKANEVAFNRAVVQVAGVARMLVDAPEITANPRERFRAT